MKPIPTYRVAVKKYHSFLKLNFKLFPLHERQKLFHFELKKKVYDYSKTFTTELQY